MDNHTAPELLEAVGITVDTGGTCPSGHRLFMGGDYTGPALGTPELDAILLVAGQRWLQNVTHSGKRDIAKNLHYDSFEEDSGGWISGRLGLLFQSESPGHALARAIREVNHA